MAGITHRQAPRAYSIITAPSPPGGLRPAARRHSPLPLGAPARAARRHYTFRTFALPHRLAELPLPPGAKRQQWPLPLICFRPPGGSLAPPGAIPVALCYWFIGTLNRSQGTSNHTYHNSHHMYNYPFLLKWLDHNAHIFVNAKKQYFHVKDHILLQVLLKTCCDTLQNSSHIPQQLNTNLSHTNSYTNVTHNSDITTNNVP